MAGVQEKEAGTPPAMAVPPVLVKGKRSKRQRVHAPPVVAVPVAAAAEWSSSSAASPAGGDDSVSGTATSPSAADDAEAASAGCCLLTEEDEDMALCLMLLAHGEPARDDGGGGNGKTAAKEASSRFRSRRPAAAGDGEYVYECKTCNKCFLSFQALGGHRTSHKKPRLLLLPPVPSQPTQEKDLGLGLVPAPAPAAAETAEASPSPAAPAEGAADATALAIPVAAAPKQEGQAAAAVAVATSSTSNSSSSGAKQPHHRPRVHECSICGAEFGSGQALGGHMRRHRPLVPAGARERDDAHAPSRKEKSLLELDLNMPAPCDETDAPAVTSPRFAFAVAERPPAPLLFPPATPSALVDCHY
ncbi:Zinc finger protein ZAT5 [Zea mays]|uniref:Zinc finger protein ZAT5 n=2 Tax=Zea mays TaxID=4577 RepID=A0A3L6G7N2_MAIZE|nr:Zinc finger protein ZAT5 [Zea mays]ACF79311.1 unknown [Zea mays]PWZ41490.1 Zinc finger protein ZAT5 [Zea mays]|eukprot:NP_001130923.1 uncharacterized protein LOC100192028 [Zea mays]